jgi:hypothetical protein
LQIELKLAHVLQGEIRGPETRAQVGGTKLVKRIRVRGEAR